MVHMGHTVGRHVHAVGVNTSTCRDVAMQRRDRCGAAMSCAISTNARISATDRWKVECMEHKGRDWDCDQHRFQKTSPSQRQETAKERANGQVGIKRCAHHAGGDERNNNLYPAVRCAII